MTAQISDKFFFQGEKYSLIGISHDGLASPEQYGMEPIKFSTACYRGFYATYELTGESLFLRELTLKVKKGNCYSIGGIEPDRGDYGTTTYTGLSEIIPFTGVIRLAKGLIDGYYIDMGYQKATAFETVLDITINDGRLVKINDLSQEMEQKRGAFKKHYESGHISQTTYEAFSLNLNLK